MHNGLLEPLLLAPTEGELKKEEEDEEYAFLADPTDCTRIPTM
jgi:hypothetical protein